jgi:hypothetical protein
MSETAGYWVGKIWEAIDMAMQNGMTVRVDYGIDCDTIIVYPNGRHGEMEEVCW